MSKKHNSDASIVACPLCGSAISVACVALGTLTGEEAWSGRFGGIHRARQLLANEIAPYLPKPPKPPTGCQCTNHMGHAKQQHQTREKAVMWAARSPRVRGMRLEPYRCPTSSAWHIRSAKRGALV